MVFSEVVAQFFLLTLVVTGGIFSHRRLGIARSHLKPRLVFDDYFLAMLVAIGIVTVSTFTGIGSIVAAVLGVVTLVWWFDGILFCATGFNITAENIKSAVAGWHTIRADAPQVARVIVQRHWSLGAPIAIIAAILVLLGPRGVSAYDHVFIGLAVVGLVVAVSKSKITWGTFPLALLGFGGAAYTAQYAAVVPPSVLASASAAALALTVLIASSHESGFWNRRSPLRRFLVGQGLKASPGEFVSDSHVFEAAIPAPERHSDNFAELADRSVLLVVLESFAYYPMEEALANRALRLPFLKKLANTGQLSTNHYAISPNTNQAFEYLYRGGYPADATYPYVRALRENGYETALVTTQDLNDFRRFEIADRIGFDHAIDRKSAYFRPELEDYNLLEQVDTVAEILKGGRGFVHVMNNQPHSPYLIVDEAYLPRNNSRKARYYASLEETDRILERWFAALEERVDLSEVLIALVGDHGQSFGEMGYDMHSSSTIKEQVRVPLLLLNAPDWVGGKQVRTSHLDVMPTVCDLVGVDVPDPVGGTSLYSLENSQSLFLHSDVRVKGIPAQMSLLQGKEKWMTDLINDVTYRMDEEDRVEEVLSGKEERYLHAVLGAELRKRGFMP